MAGETCVQRTSSRCRHALVVDSTSGPPCRQMHMHALPVELKGAQTAFLGPMRDPDVAAGIAAGRLQPQPPYTPFPARALPPQQTGSPWQHRGPSRAAGHTLSQSQRAPAPAKSSWMRPARDLLAGAPLVQLLRVKQAICSWCMAGADEVPMGTCRECCCVSFVIACSCCVKVHAVRLDCPAGWQAPGRRVRAAFRPHTTSSSGSGCRCKADSRASFPLHHPHAVLLRADAVARNPLTGPSACPGRQHTGAQEQQQDHAQGCAAMADTSVQLAAASPGSRRSLAGSPRHLACSLHKRKRSIKENDRELAKVALQRKVRMPAGGTPTGRGTLSWPTRALQAQAGTMAGCTGAEAPSGPVAPACNLPAQAGLWQPRQQPGDAADERLVGQSRTSVATVGGLAKAACGPAPDRQPEEASAAAGQGAAAVSCVVTPCNGTGGQQPVSLPGPQAGAPPRAALDADVALARAIAAEQMLPQQWLEWQLSPRCNATPLSARSSKAVCRSSSEPSKLRRASSQLAAEPANSIRRFFTAQK